jgi:hypothetical protein
MFYPAPKFCNKKGQSHHGSNFGAKLSTSAYKTRRQIPRQRASGGLRRDPVIAGLPGADEGRASPRDQGGEPGAAPGHIGTRAGGRLVVRQRGPAHGRFECRRRNAIPDAFLGMAAVVLPETASLILPHCHVIVMLATRRQCGVDPEKINACKFSARTGGKAVESGYARQVFGDPNAAVVHCPRARREITTKDESCC